MNGRCRPQAKIRQQADNGGQDSADQTRAPANPAQGRGQSDIVGAHSVGGSLQARCVLHHRHHCLDFRQRARKPRRQMIRQQTERAMACWTIPARDPCPRRIHPGVRAVAGKPAAAFRVKRATRKTCAAPQLQGNVIAAGVPRIESKLHRHRPALAAPFAGHPHLIAIGPSLLPVVALRNPSPRSERGQPMDVLRIVWTTQTPRCPHSPTACPPPLRIALSARSTRPSGLTRFACPKHF